jgi:hypothetical protein
MQEKRNFFGGILGEFLFDFGQIIKMLRIICDKAHFLREKILCSATPSALRARATRHILRFAHWANTQISS